jgi:amino acid transporter
MTPSSQAVVAFNEVWDPDSWQRVLDLARANGWDYEPFSWSSTFGMLLVVVWAFNGIEVASYAGGEVQAPERSYFRGLLLGWLGVGLLYMVTAASVIYSFGGISDAYHFLQANHSKELKEIMPAITPSVPFYMMCIVRSPVVAFMAAVAFVLWFAKIIPAVYLTCSRLMFALAMDRLLPQRFADVHPVTAVPTWATHTTALIGLVGAGFYYFKVGTVLGTLMFCTMFVAWPVGLALAVLPFRHPELIRVGWLRSPRILGLWPATWLGGITFVSGLILLYLAGREISSTAWIGIAIVVGLLLLNYFVRSSRLKAETSGQGAADLLPPDSVPATGGHRSL